MKMKEWNKLNLGWKNAFINAWDAFKVKTIPIGCVIQNEMDETVAIGRNMIYQTNNSDMILYNNKLAHAEINAILLLKESSHPNLKKYTLYTTMEPCILCFGAMVMGNIRNVKYAARDRFAGATTINKIHEYTVSKKINVEGPIEELEYFQICIQSYYELENHPNNCERILVEFEKDCMNGVITAKKLFENKILNKYCEENKNIEYIYNKLLENY
jgi:tRNA(adenine34) deaminase